MSHRIALAMAVFGLAAMPLVAHADGDVEKGEKVFKKCAVCHAIGPDAKNKVGPELNGIIGSKAGVVEGFKFSEAMIKAGEDGLVWDEDKLDEYLADPKAMIPGNKMAFPGLKNEDDRKDVIAYIKSASA